MAENEFLMDLGTLSTYAPMLSCHAINGLLSILGENFLISHVTYSISF